MYSALMHDNRVLNGSLTLRQLKGALTPHIKDYRLEIKYEDDSVESVAESLRMNLKIGDKDGEKKPVDAKPIPLYDSDFKDEHPKAGESGDIFEGTFYAKLFRTAFYRELLLNHL
jgi:hypothetical protein